MTISLSPHSMPEMTGGTKLRAARICAGHVADINRDSGQWLFVDIGFSSTQPSCGVLHGAGEPAVVTFGELVTLATEEMQCDGPHPLNLLIEAPLSVAFRENGNPTRRVCDVYQRRNRDWYVNAGATTLIAAGYLLRALHGCPRLRDVRLFEGFASFKNRQERPRNNAERIAAHQDDVLALREAVWNQVNAQLFGPEQLQQQPNDRIVSPFPFLDEDLIPPVIRINPDP